MITWCLFSPNPFIPKIHTMLSHVYRCLLTRSTSSLPASLIRCYVGTKVTYYTPPAYYIPPITTNINRFCSTHISNSDINITTTTGTTISKESTPHSQPQPLPSSQFKQMLTKHGIKLRDDDITKLLQGHQHKQASDMTLAGMTHLLDTKLTSLKELGFDIKSKTALVTNSLPAILDADVDKVGDLVSMLTQLGVRNVYTSIANCPSMLYVSIDDVKATIQVMLGDMFHKKEVLHLINTYPHILTWSADYMMKYYVYLTENMGLAAQVIVKSPVWKLSFASLYNRHKILVYTGQLDNKVCPSKASHHTQQPKLAGIIKGDDGYFAMHVAGISLDEFQCFCDLQDADDLREVKRNMEYVDMPDNVLDVDDIDDDNIVHNK